jgi:plasmid stabilization system protein ParE
MRVLISKRAARAAERIDDRWRQHADYKLLFADEFGAAIELLATTPTPGSSVPTDKRPGLKRLLLSKSRCHLYFEIVGDTIRILHVWHASRERAPKL